MEHFAALSSLGWDAARYLNHELLLPLAGKLSFKMNPRLAAERLGSSGWRHLQGLLESSSAGRPYFCAYQNGKAAVRVAAAAAAAGVHGWTLKEPSGKVPWLNGPVILHFPAPSREAFRRKFSSKAESAPLKPSFFEPSPVETAALELIGTARERGSSEEALARQLASLHESLTHFSEIEWELLEEAGLLFRPDTNRASSLEKLFHE